MGNRKSGLLGGLLAFLTASFDPEHDNMQIRRQQYKREIQGLRHAASAHKRSVRKMARASRVAQLKKGNYRKP